MKVSEQLVQHLEQEILWMKELNNILAQEAELLMNKNFSDLEKLSQLKMDLSDRIEKSAYTRVNLMNSAEAHMKPQEVFKAFLEQCSESEAESIRLCSVDLAEELAKCSKLNSINGQVIATNMHTRETILNELTGRSAQGVTYSVAGRVMKRTDKGGGLPV